MNCISIRKGRIHPAVLLLLLIAIALGIWLYFFLVPTSIPNEQAQATIRKVRLANGYLENETEFVGVGNDGQNLTGYIEADKRYSELREELPGEILPLRNLAVCRVLYFGFQEAKSLFKEDERAEWLEKSREAIASLKEAEPNGVAAWVLSALLEKAANGGVPNDAMLDELRTAQKKDPTHLPAFYLFYEASEEVLDSDALIEERDAALARCYELAPNNIAIAKDYFIYLADKQDPSTKKTLEDASELVLSLARLTEIESGPDSKISVAKMYNEALTKIDEGDWRMAKRNVQRIRNVINPTGAQKSDLKKVSPRELEYMLHRLSDAYYARIIKPAKQDTNWSANLKGPSLIAELAGVTDLLPISFDLDPIPELVTVAKNQLVVLHRDEKGKWNEAVKQELGGKFEHVICADLDRDNKAVINPDWKSHFQVENPEALNELPADVDVVVFGESGFKVFTNVLQDDGSRTLVEIPQPAETQSKNILAGTFIDIDTDSDLDLVFSTEEGLRVFLNPGNAVFGEYTDYSAFPETMPKVTSLSIVDWDRDVDVDLLAGCADGSVAILENLRHGRFRWSPLNLSSSTASSISAAHPIEFDGNVSWDILALTDKGIELTRTSTIDAQEIVLQGTETSSGKFSEFAIGDANNDMTLDVATVGDSGIKIFAGNTEVGFTSEPNLSFELAGAKLLRSGDIDFDGFIEFIAVTDAGVHLIENEPNENYFVNLFPVGADTNSNISGRVNHNGIGSLVEMSAGGRYQAQMVTNPMVHFGTGANKQADVARILWTYGMPQAILEPETNRMIRELMYDKGSCPFIYTWNGQQFVFFTDCLWAAPIGLQAADGVLVPTREWEYLKIPGDNLKPKDGYYEIKLTEELWEAAYFDHVQLIAVDHPADIDIFTNEKVGPPSITQHKIFKVKDKRLPITASDRDGNDLRDKLAAEDGEYAVPFRERIFKGLTPMHHLELDLGDLKDAKQITLFLTGWIRPTDSSTNIGFSQNPNIENPQAPTVWVMDENGQWKLAMAPMGFPGGKSKTIAVDLSKAFLCDNYRVQIRTSNEIYWDHAFFSVDEADHPIQTFEMNVEKADLQYRGFSRRYFPDQNSPEWFDYQTVTTEPRWPPMRGKFTRYGDVKELLMETDDIMAVIGSGDEISVSFKAPEKDIPAGWKRDFILHCVGYDKDADLNTVYGQTAEPLPFRGMKSYPYGADQTYPDSKKHREFLKNYQTREQNWGAFWRGVQRNKVEITK